MIFILFFGNLGISIFFSLNFITATFFFKKSSFFSENKSIFSSDFEKYIVSKFLVLFFSIFITGLGLRFRFFFQVSKSFTTLFHSFETLKSRFIQSDKSILSSKSICKSFICSIFLL
ncbi:hypothetical protein D8B46_03400 [Candidatus Gracilibacteria bacterium]|nr:MAG: hypothetical protein D8B46_03400 [Candidatus Gracilibacteria bacterium]